MCVACCLLFDDCCFGACDLLCWRLSSVAWCLLFAVFFVLGVCCLMVSVWLSCCRLYDDRSFVGCFFSCVLFVFLLFRVCCVTFAVCCVLFDVWCVLCWRLLCIVCCLSFIVRCLLFVG